MKTGTELILEERQRQIMSEGYTPEHDDAHANQELQRAAESYLLSAEMTLKGFSSFRPPDGWPWEMDCWNPSTAIRDFTKAGALWLAEIDRQKRLGAKHRYPTILKDLGNRVESCARAIDEQIAKSRIENLNANNANAIKHPKPNP